MVVIRALTLTEIGKNETRPSLIIPIARNKMGKKGRRENLP